jgi:serine/threonine protein kinase
LGSGHFGKATKARGIIDNKIVCIETISLPKDAEERRIYFRESNILSKLTHPNIIGYITSLIDSSNLYIITEYADGGDIGNYLKKSGGK